MANDILLNISTVCVVWLLKLLINNGSIMLLKEPTLLASLVDLDRGRTWAFELPFMFIASHDLEFRRRKKVIKLSI